MVSHNVALGGVWEAVYFEFSNRHLLFAVIPSNLTNVTDPIPIVRPITNSRCNSTNFFHYHILDPYSPI